MNISNILSAVSTIFAYASTAYAKVESINPTSAKVLGFLAGIILYNLVFAIVKITCKVLTILAFVILLLNIYQEPIVKMLLGLFMIICPTPSEIKTSISRRTPNWFGK